MNRYITTPIYYASGSPHLGHAYTTFIADCFKRYYELQGESVKLVTGTDEHGQKIERVASRLNVPVNDFVDARAAEFERAWTSLDIAVDHFERTTDANHQHFAQAFWKRLIDNDDIYLDDYSGLYCVECEQYFTEVEDGEQCPIHRRELEQFNEPSYFFRLGRYRQALIEHVEAHPEFILPVERRNEVLSFLRSNKLRDLSVSRTSTTWGVPIEDDPTHVQYVWVDALTTYLSALSPNDQVALDDTSIINWWRNTTHFIGKDILTFHTVYWPALLLSARLPLPKSIFVNGWLTVEGRKIAKSDPETVIDPVKLAKEVGVDGLKYYFLRTVAPGKDLNFTRSHLVEVINADLANNFGNLCNRFVALAFSALSGEWTRGSGETNAETALFAFTKERAREVTAGFAQSNTTVSARAFIEAVAEVNRYFQQAEPWKIKHEARLRTVLWTVHQVLADVILLATPFVPRTAARATAALCLPADRKWSALGERPAIVRVTQEGAVYPRLKLTEEEISLLG